MTWRVAEHYAQEIWVPPFTLRTLSAYLINQGSYRNTLDELHRLNVPNMVANDDTPFQTGYLIFLWEFATVADSSGPTTSLFVKLRMTQRNDGRGISKHPRLRSSVGSSTARHDTRNVRVGIQQRLDGVVIGGSSGGGGGGQPTNI